MKRLALLGPILFAVVLSTLTIIKYDFLISLGWDPIRAPTFDWPSGLALGKYGFVMTATFIISGLLMFVFALRLKADLKSFDQTQGRPAGTSQAGSILLALRGGLTIKECIHRMMTTLQMKISWSGRGQEKMHGKIS